jgi:hypothetical protein
MFIYKTEIVKRNLKYEMSSVLDKQGDVRNFRSWYYDNLGLRGVEQRKALDLLLKDDEIGKT